ncbi:MAG: protein arginine kinase [Clostridia bacterium]|nr:protein arginine kinase [Clostridia bacterium]
MTWYNDTGKESSTVLSTRIRFARNLADYPFGSRLSAEKANEIIEKLAPTFENIGFKKIDFTKISKLEALSYLEKHYVSREFTEKKTPHALMLNEPCGYAVMLCEEDHIRMQCILPGLALDEAYASICKLDDTLDSSFEIAYNEELGYLTHCPTNLGTGMRASVMMFLPALTMGGQINGLSNQLSKIGLTMRGFYGEGSSAQGAIYQISNQITLGITEEDSIKKLQDIVKQITEQETELRKLITSEKNPELIDRISRAEGILRHAFMISSSEFISAFSDVRLGIDLGIIRSIDLKTLGELFIEVMPATLSLSAENPPKTQKERDILRAERIKSRL